MPRQHRLSSRRRRMQLWSPDASAVALLDSVGGPFATRLFRDSLVETVSEWRDISFGARADDGTLAAIPMLERRGQGESVPPFGYGGITCTRSLAAVEASALFDTMWDELNLRRQRIRWLDDADTGAEIGLPFATASVVMVKAKDPPANHYTRLTRRSLKRALAAGATAAEGSADEFWSIYAMASRGWRFRYPEQLIRRLVEVRAGHVHVVRVGDEVVAALLTVRGASHWMCWLAGQTDAGRQISASYLAYDALFNDALTAGVGLVNLGTSVAGGAEFKHHLGAVDLQMRQWLRETRSAAATRKLAESGGAVQRVWVRARHVR